MESINETIDMCLYYVVPKIVFSPFTSDESDLKYSDYKNIDTYRNNLNTYWILMIIVQIVHQTSVLSTTKPSYVFKFFYFTNIMYIPIQCIHAYYKNAFDAFKRMYII